MLTFVDDVIRFIDRGPKWGLAGGGGGDGGESERTMSARKRPWAEPFKIKVVESLSMLDRPG